MSFETKEGEYMNFWKIGSGVFSVWYAASMLSLLIVKIPVVPTIYKPAAAVKVVDIAHEHIFQELAKRTEEVKKKGTVVPEPAQTTKKLAGFQVTWYNNKYDNTDITASGTKTVAGRTISVDPTIIPIGSWVNIYMPNGDVLKRRAEDTGGAIHGRILDVYADQPISVLMARGRTYNVTVEILEEG